MTWREQHGRVKFPDGRTLIGARYRGIPFFVESGDRSGGRRIVVHEFPRRDDPYVDDLGRRARTFSVDAYVLGDDYIAQRDALLEALEDVEGPGELVHPHHGRLRAICGSVTVRETTADGGIARFAIEFTETPVQSVAAHVDPDPAGQVDLSASAASETSAAALEDTFSIAGLPSYAIESAEAAVSGAADALGDALQPIVRDTQELAKLNARTRLLVLEASTLARTPADALVRIAELLDGLVTTVDESPGDVMRALVSAYETPALGASVLATTLNRIRERANQDALQAAIRRFLAIEAARLAVKVEFASHEEAADARSAITALLDEQAAAADDEAYAALVQLRADLTRAVPGDAVLARLVSVERRTATPSLVLAYQLYGSVENEADIIARNSIRHPGVISGTLSVLSDV